MVIIPLILVTVMSDSGVNCRENKGNDHQLKKLLIVQQILPVRLSKFYSVKGKYVSRKNISDTLGCASYATFLFIIFFFLHHL